MKTVGQMLRGKRESLGMKLSQVAKVIRIRVEYLEALEKDEYQKLPSAAYAKGFIKNYARSLGMPAATLIAIFRRDFAEDEQGQIVPRGMVKPLDQPKFSWTPQLTLIVAVVAVVSLLGSYFGYQYYRTWHPKLEIWEPEENQLMAGFQIMVRGQADPSAVVRVNDQLVMADDQGRFEISLTTGTGEQIISVEAETERGGKTVKSRKIFVKPAD